VSIKIKSADSKSRELVALRAFHGTGASHYIVKLLDDFVHEGPNGCHQCLVLELLGPSVENIANDYRVGGDRLEPETILKITTQLLQAVRSIHTLGFVHGGL
jgi:serine/threonine-protein kinase SRPK3